MLRQEDTLENDNDVGDKGEWTKADTNAIIYQVGVWAECKTTA